VQLSISPNGSEKAMAADDRQAEDIRADIVEKAANKTAE